MAGRSRSVVRHRTLLWAIHHDDLAGLDVVDAKDGVLPKCRLSSVLFMAALRGGSFLAGSLTIGLRGP